MENLAGVQTADQTILEELYLAGITAYKVERTNSEVPYTYMGMLHNWKFKRAWYYWIAFAENRAFGLPLNVATILHNKKHPIKNSILGDEIRAGGHAGGISPDDYVSHPIYNDDLDNQLLALGYEKKYSKFVDKDIISISVGEIAQLCNEGKLKVERYVDCYHIDTQVGLNEFVKFIDTHY